MKSVVNNKFAVFIIILIVVGLFLHYEMGYKFDLFSVGGRKGHRHHHHRHHKAWHRGWGNWRHWGYHLYPEYDSLQSRFNRLVGHHEGHHSGTSHSVEPF